jgi:hypothetical protein
MENANGIPIIYRHHARARSRTCARLCGTHPADVRRQVYREIAAWAPRLTPFIGILDGNGKVALMHHHAPSPVVRYTGDSIELVSVLRPGQRAIRSDTIELWVE